MNKTPWFIFSQDLDRVYAVFYVKNKWDKYSKLKKAKSQKYIKLISRYEAILNRKIDIISKISNIEPIELMME